MSKEFSAAEINMMPKSARPINCAQLTAQQISDKYSARCKRVGKTAKNRGRKSS